MRREERRGWCAPCPAHQQALACASRPPSRASRVASRPVVAVVALVVVASVVVEGGR